MKLNAMLIDYVKKIIKEDRKNIFHLFYYSIIDAILVLSIPLASAIVINSVLAHASLSIIVLGSIVLLLFVFITILQLLKEYIVEKFQQKVFVKTGIEVATKALGLKQEEDNTQVKHGKLMNYFFDITSIQKFFPILLLDGLGRTFGNADSAAPAFLRVDKGNALLVNNRHLKRTDPDTCQAACALRLRDYSYTTACFERVLAEHNRSFGAGSRRHRAACLVERRHRLPPQSDPPGPHGA